MRLSVIFCFVSSILFAQKEFDFNAFDKVIQQEIKHKKLTATTPISLAPSENYDVKYVRLFFNPDMQTGTLQGDATYYFEKLNTTNNIAFDLHDSMQVLSVNWQNSVLPFTHTNNVLTVRYPSIRPLGLDSLTIKFRGNPSGSGFGSYVLQTHGPDSMPTLWTLSQPYGARDWYPCKMTLTDKIDSIDVFIQTPKTLMGVSNGLLVNTQPIDSLNQLFHWRHRHPIATYLIAIAVSDYDTITRQVATANGSIPIQCYVYPEKKSDWEADVNNVTATMKVFDSLLGSYPFANEYYGQTQFAWGGGMEHQTNSFMYNLNFDLVSHEMAHQWFGDNITCASWQDVWLNEGFATYGNILAYEYLTPYIKGALGGSREVATRAEKGSVYVDDTTSFSSIFNSQLSYYKAAYVIHMIRWKMGDSLFFKAINDYQNYYAGGFVGTADFERFVSLTSGQDFSSFFKKWIYGSGYPSYTVLWSQNKSKLQLKLLQQTSDPASVDFFDMPVPIKCYYDGRDTLLVLPHNYSCEIFNLDFTAKIDSIEFDPNLSLLSKNNQVYKLATLNDPSKIELYPNPTQGLVTCLLDASLYENISLCIIETSGKVIYSSDFQPKSFIQIIDLGDFQNGTYTFSFFEKGKIIKSTKVVKY